MKRYDIIVSQTRRELIKLVNEKMEEGWEPSGNVMICESTYDNIKAGDSRLRDFIKWEYNQTMYKIGDKKEEKKIVEE